MNRRLNLARDLISDRRRFFLQSAAWSIVPYISQILPSVVLAAPSFSSNPFTLGVASGDPSSDGFVIWTRLAPDPTDGGGMPPEVIPVQWSIANDDKMKDVVQSGATVATPQLGHSVHVEVAGLKPDHWYFYQFRCGDAESRVGRTRTFPAATVMPDKLKFAFASCQSWEQGFYTGYQHMLKDDLDLVVHLGDYIYEYGGKEKKPRKHIGNEINSLVDYRNRYAQYRTDEHLQSMHAQCPWLVVWDDHEVDNNYCSDISEEHSFDKDLFLLRRANAYQAFYEMMPLRRSSLPKGPDSQIYRSIPFGQLANFHMLDTRQYRSDQPNGDGNKPLTDEVFNPQATMLGIEQERWLCRELIASTGAWNVLGQQVMMARVDRMEGEPTAFSMDQWAGYDVPRRRLLSFLEERQVPNPIVLTGDIHSNWVNDLKVDFNYPDSKTIATEFVCTSISSGGNGIDRTKNHDHILAENPFVKFQNSQRGYTRCEVTPKQWKADYQVLDYVETPGSPINTRASFVVESGHPGAQLQS